MKILQVNKPMQVFNSDNPEYPQGNQGFIPTWTVMTERTRIGESVAQFLKKKEAYIEFINKTKGLNIEGIYLYAIQGMIQGIVGRKDKEMCYYIRYDYIKPKK